jgi:hypothetical protein
MYVVKDEEDDKLDDIKLFCEVYKSEENEEINEHKND